MLPRTLVSIGREPDFKAVEGITPILTCTMESFVGCPEEALGRCGILNVSTTCYYIRARLISMVATIGTLGQSPQDSYR